jgi:uncharacterized protein (DUF1697 family)
MTTYVSMIRGINVGGHGVVKMDRLVGLYEDLGLEQPRSYLQSGNVVFGSRRAPGFDHAGAIERRIKSECGLDVAVAVLTAREMARALEANPIARRPGVDPRFLHATFVMGREGPLSLEGAPLPLLPGEDAVLVGRVVYLYCPNGYGVSKINNTFFERRLRARATTRNWNTVTALERMARGEPPA